MRKFTAVLLILIFAFNLVGYRFVVDYMLHKANTQLEARLDNDQYDDSQLIELKVPINLPYLTSWASFQRYDGQIELNGVLYHYVKRKVSNDTLYVMAIPNTKVMHLESAKNDFVKGSLDLNQNDNSKKSDDSKTISFKNLQGDYDEYTFSISCSLMLKEASKCWLPLGSSYIISTPRLSPEQPPDALDI